MGAGKSKIHNLGVGHILKIGWKHLGIIELRGTTVMDVGVWNHDEG